MIHGGELAGVNEKSKPETEMNGAEEDGFEFIEVEEVFEFLCLVFGDALFVDEKGEEVESDDKKPPSIFGKVFHSAVTAHDPTWDGGN
jgi:hypothetical protein